MTNRKHEDFGWIAGGILLSLASIFCSIEDRRTAAFWTFMLAIACIFGWIWRSYDE